MNGLYFALQSGDKHRKLRLNLPYITRHDNSDDEPAYFFVLGIVENITKDGGLRQRKVLPKRVKHFANTENPGHCFVCVFNLYVSTC